MTIFVTGASGHIGGNLVRALLDDGKAVRVLVHHDERALEGLEVERISGDVLDVDGMESAVRGADLVYHLAGHISLTRGDRDKALTVNIEGTRNVVDACLKGGVRRLVHFSSSHALEQDPFDQVIDEERPLVARERGPAYDRSKAAGERHIAEAVERGLDAVVVNPTSVLGPCDYKPSRMGDLVLALSRRKLPALVSAQYDWVDVRDVVAGAIAAAERGRTGQRYILSGHRVTVRELAQLVENASGARAPRLSTPLWLAMVGAPFAEMLGSIRKKRPLFTRESIRTIGGNSQFSNARAAAELGYAPRPLSETIADTVRWFEEVGWLGNGAVGE